MSLYGYGRDTTPELKRYFPGQSVYRNAWSSAPCTKPAVEQLLSGTLQPSTSIAQFMQREGYETSAVVSQHILSLDEQKYNVGFDHWDIQAASEVDQHGMTARTAQQVTDRSIRWLAGRDSARPFFLWAHYFDPHDPYSPPAEFIPEATEAFSDPVWRGDRRSRPRTRANPFTEEETSRLRALYDAEVAYVDREVGRLLDTLASRGILDRTLVILTSDHGEWLGEGGRWDHCQTLQRQEMHVPFAVRVPGWTPPRSDLSVVSTLDIVPTILDFVGIDYSVPNFVGRSLFQREAERWAVAVWVDHGFIRQERWFMHCKVVSIDDGDQAECRPLKLLADSKENLVDREPIVRDRLARRFSDLTDLHAAKRVSDEAVEQLRSVGYLE